MMGGGAAYLGVLPNFPSQWLSWMWGVSVEGDVLSFGPGLLTLH